MNARELLIEWGLDYRNSIVIGSTALRMAGVITRNPADLDVVVDELTFCRLSTQAGWGTGIHSTGHSFLTHQNLDVTCTWTLPNGEEQPLDILRAKGVFINDDIAYASPSTILEWRYQSNRPKDKRDVPWVEAYLGRKALQQPEMRDKQRIKLARSFKFIKIPFQTPTPWLLWQQKSIYSSQAGMTSN